MNAKSHLSVENVNRLLLSLLGPKCTCILGAGASVPILPADLNALALELVLRNTDYLLPGWQSQTSKDRNWIKPIGYEWSSFVPGAINQSTQQALRLVEYQVTKPPILTMTPAQYLVFHLIPLTLKILTFNYDGLAKRFCPQPYLKEMHGRHSAHFPYGRDMSTLYELARHGYNVTPNTFHAFEPETPDMYSLREEWWFYQALSECSDLILIGYSFAQNGRRLNDQETYNRVCYYLRDKAVRVTVVDPYPDALVDRLRHDLRNDDITGLPVYWNHLARAIIRTAHTTIEGDVRGAHRFTDDVYRNYNDFRQSHHRDLNEFIEHLADSNLSDEQFVARKNYINAHR